MLWIPFQQLSAEQPLDSLRQVWADEATDLEERYAAFATFYKYQVSNDPRKVLETSSSHIALAQSEDNREQVSDAHDIRARAYYILGLPDSAVVELKASLLIAEQLEDTSSMVSIYSNMGLIESASYDYENAMSFYRRSLSLMQDGESPVKRANVLNNMGSIYQRIGALDLAQSHLDSAGALYLLSDAEEKMGMIQMNLAKIEIDRDNLPKARTHCRKAIGYFSDQNEMASLSGSYFMMANILERTKQLDSAKTYIYRSIDIQKKIGSVHRIADQQILLYYLLEEEQPGSGAFLADSIEAKLPFLKGNSMHSKAYKLLHTKYKKAGNLDVALQMNDLYLLYLDSLDKEKAQAALIREAMDESYKHELRQIEIKNQEETKKLQTGQMNRLGILATLAFSMIAALLWFTGQRTKRQAEELQALMEQLEEQRELNRSQDDRSVLDTGFTIDRERIEASIQRKLNETDWKVLTILSKDPVISNKDIAEQAFISVDGIGSSLRRMYIYFEVKESKYKKISLILDAIKISRK